MRAAVLAAVMAAGGAVALAAEVAPDRVERLVDRLGSGGFRDREAATRELDGLGEPALDALRRAAASGEPEVRRRAADLVERITDRLATARILAPTLVEFDYKDKPLTDAVADLNRRTGANFLPHDPTPNKFRGRTVTAASGGPIPFWEAVELFCRKADLHEWDRLTPVTGLNHQQAATEIIGQGGFQGRIIINGGRSRPVGPPSNAMVLLDGPGAALPSDRGGAVRVRVLPPSTSLPNAVHAPDEVVLALHVSAEPKLNWHGAAEVRVDRAVDETGRALTAAGAVAMVPAEEGEIFINQFGMVTQAPARRGGAVGVRIRRGDKPSKRLTELTGSIAAQFRLSEPLAVVAKPLQAVGQSIHGSRGVDLQVKSAAKADNGEVSITAEVRVPSDIQLPQMGGIGMNGVVFGGAMQIQGNVIIRQIGPGGVQVVQNQTGQALPAGTTEFQGLSLEDAKGTRFAAVRGTIEMSRYGPDGSTFQIAATFRGGEKERESAKLVFTATRPATLDIPFTVKDVPLP